MNASAGTTADAAAKSVKVTVAGASLAAQVNSDSVKIVNASDNKVVTGELKAGESYKVQVSDLKLQGLTTGNNYAIAGGTVDGKTSASASTLLNGTTFVSDAFTIYDKNFTGTPVVTNNGQLVTSGSIELSNSTATVSGLRDQIDNNYKVVNSDSSASAKPVGFENLETAIRTALKDSKISLRQDKNTFDVPAASFTINAVGYLNNGQSVKFPITVKVPNRPQPTNVPELKLSSSAAKEYANGTTVNTYTRKVAVGSNVTADSIASDFSATLPNNKNVSLKINVKSSNLNTAVAGNYTVVLEATDNAGKTGTATVNVQVGNPGVTKTVSAGSETAKIVTINGNNVTTTNDTLENGAKVNTFGTTYVDGVSYTRLNSENSNQYVETKYVDGSIKNETGVEKTIMHNAYYYTKAQAEAGKGAAGEHGDLVKRYNKVTVVEKTVSINGKTYYKVPNKDQYINADNISGTPRTLKHNAYVYATSKKRANKKVLKKGTKLNTYGAPYKFKNGKSYYKVFDNTDKTYVKVANFE
ncbi:S-layer protein [Lactobacillus intestinalis DSM 6629]|uniref:S-layer protein n=1 Tax=Lactobacillus intestinalis DSM 6629 TaxID=1423761 RepID=A0ABR5PRZ3_9LACO|nr:S-layer protein [Lactobacillus intestinalis DSM 6629]